MSDPAVVSILLRQNIECDSGELDLIQYSKLLLQLSYILPFGVLYLSFMITIWKRKNDRELFEDSFFTLNLVDGIITLCFLVLDMFLFRIPSFVRPVCEYFVPLLKDPAFYLTPFYTTFMYAQLAKMLSTLAMSVNRYTSVNHAVRHKIFWMNNCPKIIVGIFVIPLFFVWPVAIGTTSFLPLNGNSVINYEHKVPWARTTYGRLVIATPTLIFTVYSSIITTSKLRKLGEHMKKTEYAMNAATVFTAGGFLLLVGMQLVYLFVNTEKLVNNMWWTQLILAGTQLSNDFYMLSGPVVLLILDKRIRSSIFCCKLKRRGSVMSKVSALPVSVAVH